MIKKKKNKNGFTLVELLAVIVILAIIMVIAVPQILNVINASRDSASKSSIKLAKDAIRTQTSAASLINCESFAKDGNCYIFNFDSDDNKNVSRLKLKNKDKISGTINYCSGKFEGELSFDGSSGNNDVSSSNVDVTAGLRDKVYSLYKNEINSYANYYIIYYKTEPMTASLILYNENFKFDFEIVDSQNYNTSIPFVKLNLINDSNTYYYYEGITLNDTEKKELYTSNSNRELNSINFLDDNFYLEFSKYPTNIEDYPQYKTNFGKVITDSNNKNIKLDELLKLPKSYDSERICKDYMVLLYNNEAQFYCLTGDSNMLYVPSDKSIVINDNYYVFQYRANKLNNIYLTNNWWSNVINSSYKNRDMLDIIIYSTFDIKDSDGNTYFRANTTLDKLTN